MIDKRNSELIIYRYLGYFWRQVFLFYKLKNWLICGCWSRDSIFIVSIKIFYRFEFIYFFASGGSSDISNSVLQEKEALPKELLVTYSYFSFYFKTPKTKQNWNREKRLNGFENELQRIEEEAEAGIYHESIRGTLKKISKWKIRDHDGIHD